MCEKSSRWAVRGENNVETAPKGSKPKVITEEALPYRFDWNRIVSLASSFTSGATETFLMCHTFTSIFHVLFSISNGPVHTSSHVQISKIHCLRLGRLFVLICAYLFLFALICSYLFLFALICSYLFLFALICSYLFLFVLICSYLFLFALICSYLFLFCAYCACACIEFGTWKVRRLNWALGSGQKIPDEHPPTFSHGSPLPGIWIVS